MIETIQKLSYSELFFFQFAGNLFRYFLVITVAFLIFWKWWALKHPEKIHNPKGLKTDGLKREMFYSTVALFFASITPLFILKSPSIIPHKIYFDIHERSILWYVTSLLCAFAIQDCYFYWSHRLLHTRKLYRSFHFVHHQSIYPTPYATFAFGIGEAVIHSTFILILVSILPIHYTAIMIFFSITLMTNIYGHLGMDILSEKRRNSFPFNLLFHTTHHGCHHRIPNGNYGLYFKFWDKVMGTYKGEMPKKDK